MEQGGVEGAGEQVLIAEGAGHGDGVVAEGAGLAGGAGERDRPPQAGDPADVQGIGGIARDSPQRPGQHLDRAVALTPGAERGGLVEGRGLEPLPRVACRDDLFAEFAGAAEVRGEQVAAGCLQPQVVPLPRERGGQGGALVQARPRPRGPGCGRPSPPPGPGTGRPARRSPGPGRWRSGGPAAAPAARRRGNCSPAPRRSGMCALVSREGDRRSRSTCRAMACRNRKQPSAPAACSMMPRSAPASRAASTVSAGCRDTASSSAQSNSSPITAASSMTSRCSAASRRSRCSSASLTDCGAAKTPGRNSDEPAAPGQVAPQLPQEERVTAGLLAQQRRRPAHLTTPDPGPGKPGTRRCRRW